MSSPIAVFGSINMDLVIFSQRQPEEGETIFGRSFETFQGGKGANQAVAVSRLGGEVTFIGKVGNDLFGEQLKESLVTEGIDISMLEQHEGESGIAFINVFEQSSQNQIIVVSGANAHLKSDQFLEESLKSTKVLISQLEAPVKEIEKVFSRAKEFDCYTILNTAPAIEMSEQLITKTDLFIMNESELATFSSININNGDLDSIQTAIKSLSFRDDQSVVITLGSKGVFVDSKSKQAFIQGHHVEAIDSTGSGDCFVGALANNFLEHRDLLQAVEFANKAAALSVTKKGASTSMPTIEEVNKV